MALWVEKHHGANGHEYIEQRISALEANGEPDGARLWQEVARRYAELKTGPIPIHGQPHTQPN